MATRRSSPRGFHAFAFLLAAMLALVSQITLGAVLIPDGASGGADEAIAEAAVPCVAPSPGVPHDRRHAHARAPETGICPLDAALALHAPVPPLPAPPDARARTSVRVAAAFPPPARGPPPPTARVGDPRGPPTPV